MDKRVLILGGDGFLGWPTALHQSSKGNEVLIIDNYFRRNTSAEYKVQTLYEIPSLNDRVEFWKKLKNRQILIEIGDICDYEFLLNSVRDFKPDVIIHYAEQPSAPYSMIGHKEATFTLKNNLIGTLNLIFAVKETNINTHIIKLGTMGEYGTPNIDIEEGYLKIEHNGRNEEFLFPRQSGSLYHTTKIQDTDLLYFYVRVWGLKVTDLMQGPVYGLFTDEMEDYDELLTAFNYDEIFGTVLNRFMVQAVAGVPLTVYGKGGQTRGYLNILDTLNCIDLAIQNPANSSELRILNQFTQTFSVNALADLVIESANSIGVNTKKETIVNPRKELENHYYNPSAKGFKKLGLKPNLLTQDVICKILQKIMRFKNKINVEIIQPKTKWT